MDSLALLGLTDCGSQSYRGSKVLGVLAVATPRCPTQGPQALATRWLGQPFPLARVFTLGVLDSWGACGHPNCPTQGHKAMTWPNATSRPSVLLFIASVVHVLDLPRPPRSCPRQVEQLGNPATAWSGARWCSLPSDRWASSELSLPGSNDRYPIASGTQTSTTHRLSPC